MNADSARVQFYKFNRASGSQCEAAPPITKPGEPNIHMLARLVRPARTRLARLPAARWCSAAEQLETNIQDILDAVESQARLARQSGDSVLGAAPPAAAGRPPGPTT